MTKRTMLTDDKDIIKAMKADPEKGFRLLMSRYKEPIYWYIRRMVTAHSDAEDAAQESFVRVFRSLKMFRGDSSFKVWIYRIATNEALRTLEKRNRELARTGGNVDDAASIAGDGYFDYGDKVAVKLQRAIQQLSEKQRTVFNLRYYDELSYDDIAAIVGSSAASAKVNYHIAKEKIVKFMNSND